MTDADRPDRAVGGEQVERALIEEQIHYYRRRAAEYDETGVLPGDPLAPEVERLRDALDRFRPEGNVLELACGTGKRTLWLLDHATEIAALDSSAEMLRRARDKISDPRVRFIESDVFSWTPDGAYDVVCFFFWLSHVPPRIFETFWGLVRRCLSSEGRVFFADEGRHDLWSEEFIDKSVVRRRLQDGTSHRAVKVFWEPRELEARLRELGWDVSVQKTGPYYWGEARG